MLTERAKKWINYCLAILENLLFNGLVYGWASVTFVLKEENIYGNVCEEDNDLGNGTWSSLDEETRRCPGQDEHLVLCYTVASFAQAGATVVFGVLIYKTSIRFSRMTSYVLYTAGTLCMAFLSEDIPWLMYPGWTLIGFAGWGTVVSNYQTTTKFPKRSAIAIALLHGAYDSGVIFALVLKVVAGHGFSRQNMFFVITGLHGMVLLRTLFLVPRDAKSRDGEEDKELASADQENTPEKVVTTENGDGSDQEFQTLRDCFRPLYLYTHALWLWLLNLRFVFYIGTLNQYLNSVFNEDKEEVSRFTNVFNYILMTSFVTSFLSGILYNWQERRVKVYQGAKCRKLMAAVLPLSTTSMLAVVASILPLFNHPTSVYICFAVLPFYRSLLFGFNATFMYSVYPDRYASVMYGVVYSSAGIFSVMQYAVFTWWEAYTGAVLHVNICFLALTCLTFVHPGFLWFTGKKLSNTMSSPKTQSTHM